MGGMWVMKSYVSWVIWWVMIWVACGWTLPTQPRHDMHENVIMVGVKGGGGG